MISAEDTTLHNFSQTLREHLGYIHVLCKSQPIIFGIPSVITEKQKHYTIHYALYATTTHISWEAITTAKTNFSRNFFRWCIFSVGFKYGCEFSLLCEHGTVPFQNNGFPYRTDRACARRALYAMKCKAFTRRRPPAA